MTATRGVSSGPELAAQITDTDISVDEAPSWPPQLSPRGVDVYRGPANHDAVTLTGTGLATAVVTGRVIAHMQMLTIRGVPRSEAMEQTRRWLREQQ
jgi:hypothetical protein